MHRAILFVSIALAYAGTILAQAITPHANANGRFYFQFANIYFEVDSTVGGRISSLQIDNKELLFLDRNYPLGPYWGSTLWLSPEDGNHSPLPIERQAYTGGITGNQIVLSSQNAATPTIKVIKKFQADLQDTSITIRYRIINIGSNPLWRAGWEVTRVPPEVGSLTFWPTGDTLWGSLSNKIVKNGQYSWYPFAAADPTTGTKYFADGREGWYGHVTGSGFLFVKKFTDVLRNGQAPKEAELEFWLSADHKYVELENQSLYRSIAVNDTLEYVVKWFLRKVPQNVSITVGSQSLLSYARSVARLDPTSSRNFSNRRPPNQIKLKYRYILRGSTGAFETMQPSTRNGKYSLRGERKPKTP